MRKIFDLYVWHNNGVIDYSDELFYSLTSYKGGIVENNDVLVILKRYAQRDFYNFAFPNHPPETITRFEYVRRRYCV